MDPVIVQATTACFPGIPHDAAAERIALGVSQRLWGDLGVDHLQLCPQNSGTLDEGVIDLVRRHLPATKCRLHATVKVMPDRFHGESAWLSATSRPYYKRLAQLSRYMGAQGYTFHAGTRNGHGIADTLSMADALEDLFQVPVGIEGMYPDSRHQWLMSSWGEYRFVMESGRKYAIDLSHLNIVSRAGGRVDRGLLKALLTNPNCIEIHVSDNDGVADRHWFAHPDTTPWWAAIMGMKAGSGSEALDISAPVFSESWKDWPTTNGPSPSRDLGRHSSGREDVR
jgi:sugar phosphate isomerase/epimerase